MSYCVNGLRVHSGHDWALFVFFGSSGCTFHGTGVDYFLKKFPNFCGQICSLGLRVRFRLTTLLPNVVQPTAHL